MKKTFNVHYSFYLSDSVEVEAESEKEAELKVAGMITNGEIAEDLNKMEIGDHEIWID